MTTWDRFMLSFIFGYVIGRILVSYLLAHERKKAEKNITFMGARKMSKEEMDELMKLLGQSPIMEDDDDEDEEDE